MKFITNVCPIHLQPEKIELSSEDIESIQHLSLTKEFQVVKVTSKKPNYEVGSTSQLKISFGKKKGKLFIQLLLYFILIQKFSCPKMYNIHQA